MGSSVLLRELPTLETVALAAEADVATTAVPFEAAEGAAVAVAAGVVGKLMTLRPVRVASPEATAVDPAPSSTESSVYISCEMAMVR